MATHSSLLAWEIPWTEEPGRLQFKGLKSQTRLSDWSGTTHIWMGPRCKLAWPPSASPRPSFPRWGPVSRYESSGWTRLRSAWGMSREPLPNMSPASSLGYCFPVKSYDCNTTSVVLGISTDRLHFWIQLLAYKNTSREKNITQPQSNKNLSNRSSSWPPLGLLPSSFLNVIILLLAPSCSSLQALTLREVPQVVLQDNTVHRGRSPSAPSALFQHLSPLYTIYWLPVCYGARHYAKPLALESRITQG